MLVTLTNTAGRSINVATVGEDGVSVGGGVRPDEAAHRTDPLPFPFAHIGELADAATSVLPMRPMDFFRQVRYEDQPMATEWSSLVQAGTVTLSNAVEAGRQDPYELFLGDIT